MEYQDFIDSINSKFKGYHITITLFPSGGMIEAEGCEECNTCESIFEVARWKKGKGQTIDHAVTTLKNKLELNSPSQP